MGISRDSSHKRRLTGGRVKRIRSKRKFEMGRQPAMTKVGESKVTTVRVRGGNFKHRALRLDAGNFCWPGEAVSRKARILKVVYNASSNELVRTNTLVKGCIVQIDSSPFKAWYHKFYNVSLGKVKEDEAETADKTETKAEPAPVEKQKEQKKGKKKAAKKGEAQGEKKQKGKGKVQAEKKPKEEGEKKDDKEKYRGLTRKEWKKELQAIKDAKAEGKEHKPITKKLDEVVPAEPTEKQKKRFEKRNETRVLEQHLTDQFKTGRLYARITSRPGQVGRADGIILEGEELAFYLRKIVQKKKK